MEIPIPWCQAGGLEVHGGGGRYEERKRRESQHRRTYGIEDPACLTKEMDSQL